MALKGSVAQSNRAFSPSTPHKQQRHIKLLAQYIYAITGIALDESKMYLIENRLGSLLTEAGCNNFSELYYKAKSDPAKVWQRRIVDAITTGETLFFRDTAPFEMLQHKILPDLIDRRVKAARGGPVTLRIWSAACSSGQEIYSIAMVLKELLGDFNKYSIRLLGTDISDKAIAAASRGHFSKIEIGRGLPPDKLNKYFEAVNGDWKIRDELRALASFRKINLMEDLSPLGKFDIVFCRNVAIYFNEPDKIRLFQRISRILEPDGSLIIGSTESLTTLCPSLESKRHLRSVYYQLKP